MILSNIAIRQALDAKRIDITPFDEQDLKGASYDFHLAPYFRVFIPHNETCIDPMVDQQHLTTPYSVREGDVFVLHPGQFALASSIEKFFFGRWNAGRLEGKSSLARLGLIIHSAGFFDPGFNGHATLELANPTSLPIKLYPGMLIGQMAFYAVQGEVSSSKLYGGVAANSKYQHQGEAPAPSRYFENYPDGPPNVGVTDTEGIWLHNGTPIKPGTHTDPRLCSGCEWVPGNDPRAAYADLFGRFPDPDAWCLDQCPDDVDLRCMLPPGHQGEHRSGPGIKVARWPAHWVKIPDFKVARADMEQGFVDMRAQTEQALYEAARPKVPPHIGDFRDRPVMTQELESALREVERKPEARPSEIPSLFKHEPFVGHSGRKMQVKIECDALTARDWYGLAKIASAMVGPFREVIGVPRGGLPFAQALRFHATGDPLDPILIADDVFTTGGSMREMAANVRLGPEEAPIKGVVAFARDHEALHSQPWVQAVWIAGVRVP